MQNNQMNPLEQGAPWLANYGDVPFHLEYPNVSITDAVLKTAEKEKDFPAISFMGKTFSYTVLVEKINQAAAGFVALGVKKGDMVTIWHAERSAGGVLHVRTQSNRCGRKHDSSAFGCQRNNLLP